MLLERALVVGASGASAVLARMRATVEDDLTGVVLASGMALKELEGGGEVTSRVRERLRDRLLTEIEAASEAIKRRYDERRALPAADEWREWGNLCALYERGVKSAGDDLRRLAFAKVFSDTCNYGVWQYNDLKQRPLANAIFRWLHAQAVAVGDSRAEALMAKNVACGI
jgi:phosphoglycolate phosphatase-like HAD superfamily hydrolase